MLEIKNLSISINNVKILNDINLNIKKGEVVALVGENGTGKSTLSNSIMGFEKYEKKGKIYFDKKLISNLSPEKISKLGIFLAHQNPIEIEGISMLNFLKRLYQKHTKKKFSNLEFNKILEECLKEIKLQRDFISRFLNFKFSGGEKKRSEILQMLLIKPKLIILDEIDSGLDNDGKKLIIKIIKKLRNEGKSFLIISHLDDFIKKIKPDKILDFSNKKD